MTGVSLHIDSAVVQAALGLVSERMTNARGLYDNIGAAMVVSTQMRFEREQAPDGSPWPKPLRVLVEGGNTLRLSGRLYQSLTHIADDHGVEWGTDVEYAGVHQDGKTIVPKQAGALRFKLPGNLGWVTTQSVTIPKRAFLGIDDDDEAEIVAQAEDWLAVAEGQP